MKAKKFSIDSITKAGKPVDFNFCVDKDLERNDIKSDIKQLMQKLNKPYSIYISPKEFEVDKIMSMKDIIFYLEESLT